MKNSLQKKRFCREFAGSFLPLLMRVYGKTLCKGCRGFSGALEADLRAKNTIYKGGDTQNFYFYIFSWGGIPPFCRGFFSGSKPLPICGKTLCKGCRGF